MEIHRSIEALPRLRGAVTVGIFDGMHRGHQLLLGELVRAAAAWEAEPVLITFEPHPELVLRGRAPDLVCDPEERLARLAQAGVAHTVLQRFDREFAAQSAEEFLARVGRRLELAGVVMSTESAFGRDREGTPERIVRLASREGFAFRMVHPLLARGAPVSANRIRALVGRGRLAEAGALLGRRPAVVGRVVAGNGRGRDLGYPTANLAFETPVALPPDGIYAVVVTWGGPTLLEPRRRAWGVASLGVRPTFEDGGARVLEVNLFGVDEQLRGERLRVEFVRRQRAERRFGDVRALVAQMDRDAERARAILAATLGTAEPEGADTGTGPARGRD